MATKVQLTKRMKTVLSPTASHGPPPFAVRCRLLAASRVNPATGQIITLEQALACWTVLFPPVIGVYLA